MLTVSLQRFIRLVHWTPNLLPCLTRFPVERISSAPPNLHANFSANRDLHTELSVQVTDGRVVAIGTALGPGSEPGPTPLCIWRKANNNIPHV